MQMIGPGTTKGQHPTVPCRRHGSQVRCQFELLVAGGGTAAAIQAQHSDIVEGEALQTQARQGLPEAAVRGLQESVGAYASPTLFLASTCSAR